MKILARINWVFATIIIFTALALSILLHFVLPRPYPRKLSSWFIRGTTFFTTTIEGKEADDVQMFLINHQSDLDIGVMETTTKKDLAWVAKKALFDVPFFGLAMKLPEDIEVERESKTSLVKLLKAAKDRLGKKRVITMFPEGTRSRTKRMLPFKSGAKVIADKYKLKVQPVVLINTAGCYDVKTFYYMPKTIKVIYLEPFIADKSDPDWLNNLHDTMQKVYDDELANNPSDR
ncbi:lysophospholipid acyltransferase family protein [Sulfurimonas sp. C5]|uniref:lysophospholipid acyltransferase family protein n=1 Tax=Sulfurimonas sp. C5 TaxID=3036947 RepID=UPI002455F1F1|nr:lysophospholipid acyltransferase family protein [Sulfurimonas sp. C5]MDH4945128.1 lysophospholipid acyltransferase family protein [Sulfurimonas sp. C5]